MIENIKKVSNPLTIIAIFAGLAELAGTIALPLVADELQSTFIWFVMLFPFVLVVFFFVTLNFNPKVLYSPSDYSNEENFMVALQKRARVEKNYDTIDKKLNEMKTKVETIAGKSEDSKIYSDLNKNLDSILQMVKSNQRESKSLYKLPTSSWGFKEGSIYDKALTKIYQNENITEDQLQSFLGVTYLKLKRIMKNLQDSGFITIHNENGIIYYQSKF